MVRVVGVLNLTATLDLLLEDKRLSPVSGTVGPEEKSEFVIEAEANFSFQVSRKACLVLLQILSSLFRLKESSTTVNNQANAIFTSFYTKYQ